MRDFQKAAEIFLLPGCDGPKLQKCGRQALHRLPFQPQTRVLPQSVRKFQTEIGIRQIVTAGVADFSVDDGDFPMVPVVHEQPQNRQGRVEYLTADALGIQFPGEIPIHIADGADIIVHQPHIQAFRRLPGQHLPDPAEGLFVLYNEIFHENEGFCLFQIPQKFRQCRSAVAIVPGIRGAIDRGMGVVPKILAQIAGRLVLPG